MCNEYDKQALDFMSKTNTTITIKFVELRPYFDDATKDQRDVYIVVMRKMGREFRFAFGQSLARSGNYVLLPGWKASDTCPACVNAVPRRNSHRYERRAKTAPTYYDILSSMDAQVHDSIDDFQTDYGYVINSVADYHRLVKTYNAVNEQANNLRLLYNDEELDQLADIQ